MALPHRKFAARRAQPTQSLRRAMNVIAAVGVRRCRMTCESLGRRNALGSSLRPFVEFTWRTERLRRFEKPVFTGRNHVFRIRTANMNDELHVICATLKGVDRR